MKLMIMGHAGHGKDTACKILKDDHGLTWQSSSDAACAHVVYPAMKEQCGYQTIEECFNDRHNHRPTWYQLIQQYNQPDPATLARKIFADHDVYCGIRHQDELKAARDANLFDFTIWIDASDRLPAEPDTSCTVSSTDATFVIDNNGTRQQFQHNIRTMMGYLTRFTEHHRSKKA